jgi:cytochrome c biogenesis protein CcmG, thiol:disulfide interchange protein DsbE
VTLVILAYVVGTQSADVLKEWNSNRHTDEYRLQAATQTAAILRKMGTIKVGDTLGDFSLEDIDGKVHRLSDLVTDKILITCVQPDCDACLEEMERLRRAADSPDDYKHVILITSGNPLHMQRVREDYGLKCVILYDDERQFGAALKIQSFPFNLVVDHNRVIHEIIASVLLPEDYRRLFEGGIVGQNPSPLGEWFCQPRHWNVETAGVSTYKTSHLKAVEG